MNVSAALVSIPLSITSSTLQQDEIPSGVVAVTNNDSLVEVELTAGSDSLRSIKKEDDRGPPRVRSRR